MGQAGPRRRNPFKSGGERGLREGASGGVPQTSTHSRCDGCPSARAMSPCIAAVSAAPSTCAQECQ
jgi:hypothetical protein